VKADETATIDRLVSAATAEFARRGFEGARLHDIAEGAGITRPSLLYHFPSKQGLYEAVVQRVFSALGAVLLEAIAGDAPFQARLDDVVRRLDLFFVQRPEVATLMLRELLDAQGPGHALMREFGLPILDRTERFVRDAGQGVVRADLPVRAALMQIFSGVLMESAAGPLREPFWGKAKSTRALARILFLKE
jgi:AcrR family transcriptional regulator